MRLRVLSPFLLLALLLPGPAGPPPEPLPWALERVVDGDTVAAGGYRIRLIGLNAPEIRGVCEEEKALGRRATARLEALIAGAARVELRQGPPGKYSQLQAWPLPGRHRRRPVAHRRGPGAALLRRL